ncbi:DUF1918 domain-containing protein [Streptomyces lycii]|uniref:DUF1918 domain-containing protein n=1 Tax=Streptomyces lycii TaxID=2654337 RepID=A0ABQ7FN20_9ACTN|nr:DUF1918 domain-containing protein [Streptomyces lycii]KAF4408622.1 DUF1918 domain-containing protein [Streptomyces lycii]
MTTFKRGDIAEVGAHGAVEILHGPEYSEASGADRYMVRWTQGGGVFAVDADELRAADPRVKTVADVLVANTLYARGHAETLAHMVLVALDAERAAPLAVGDRVRVPETSALVPGRTGVLVEIDAADPDMPYLVRDDIDGAAWWVSAVERI